jgi:hypothetical protein
MSGNLQLQAADLCYIMGALQLTLLLLADTAVAAASVLLLLLTIFLNIQLQAADLRYIMEAPKLELSPEERVTIPLLNSEDSWVKKG